MPSSGDADACTALSPPLHGAFSPSFSQSAAMMPRSAPSGASLGSVGPRTEPRKRWRRRLWASLQARGRSLSSASKCPERGSRQAGGPVLAASGPTGLRAGALLSVRLARQLRRVELDDVVVDARAGLGELAAHRHEEGVERVVPAARQLGASKQ
eukprot:scaffold888_cov61-Phaeocystis_antarctica.AAC.2